MWKQYFAQASPQMLELAMAALVLFGLAWTMSLARVFLGKRAGLDLDHDERLPLLDDDAPARGGDGHV